MLNSERSIAKHRVSCSKAPFEALYGTKDGWAINPLTDAMFTMLEKWIVSNMVGNV